MFDITLMPQEEACSSKFNGNLVMTRGFDRTFEPSSILLAISTLRKIIEERVNTAEGADYLQIGYFENKKFWIIDDGDYVTFLLPEEH